MKYSVKSLAFLAVMGLAITSCTPTPEGKKIDATEAQNVENTATAAAQKFAADVTTSKIEWLGTKMGGQHNGDLKLSNGEVVVEGGKIVGGTFTIDMTSINVLDLTGEAKGNLEGHLKNADFFEVETYPTGTFTITSVKEVAGTEGQTHAISGNLTLKGIEKAVNDIPANITITETGVEATTPQFVINRQNWGITYQSKMKESLLNDDMGIKITLSAK